MKWEGQEESKNVELDCFGATLKGSDAAASKCFDEISSFFKSCKGTVNEVPVLEVNAVLQEAHLIKTLADAQTALSVIEADINKCHHKPIPVLSFFGFGGDDKADSITIIRDVAQALDKQHGK